MANYLRQNPPTSHRTRQSLAISREIDKRDNGETVDYFRATELGEAVDIMDCNCFRYPPNLPVEPTAVKRFFLNQSATVSFGNSFLKGLVRADEFFVFKGTVSKVFDKMTLSIEGGDNPGDRFIGEGRAVPL
ncbi:MAG: hypothetical protein P8104_13190, partial [Gammaproteobacteria bacterium]